MCTLGGDDHSADFKRARAARAGHRRYHVGLRVTARKAAARTARPRIELGWAELVDLPELHLDDLPAKIDTGARTSSLHATHIRITGQAGVRKARDARARQFSMPLFENRRVRSSNGHHEDRPVIRTPVVLGGIEQLVEITLTHRGTMAFPMLVGRSTLKRHYLVNCRRKYATRPIAHPSAVSGADAMPPAPGDPK